MCLAQCMRVYAIIFKLCRFSLFARGRVRMHGVCTHKRGYLQESKHQQRDAECVQIGLNAAHDRVATARQRLRSISGREGVCRLHRHAVGPLYTHVNRDVIAFMKVNVYGVLISCDVLSQMFCDCDIEKNNATYRLICNSCPAAALKL